MCSFYACRSQKHKKLLELTLFFALLGSACIKAAHKTLMKLTQGGNIKKPLCLENCSSIKSVRWVSKLCVSSSSVIHFWHGNKVVLNTWFYRIYMAVYGCFFDVKQNSANVTSLSHHRKLLQRGLFSRSSTNDVTMIHFLTLYASFLCHVIYVVSHVTKL